MHPFRVGFRSWDVYGTYILFFAQCMAPLLHLWVSRGIVDKLNKMSMLYESIDKSGLLASEGTYMDVN